MAKSAKGGTLHSGNAEGTQYVAGASKATTTTPVPVRYAGGKRVLSADITALVIADKIIDVCNEHGDWITNLKLQKLLYYAQSWYLALYNRPLFDDTIEAWVNGPAQPTVYGEYSKYGVRPIDRPPIGIKLPPRIEEHIEEVMHAYGHLSAFDLQRLACQEDPWLKARNGLAADEPSDRVVSTSTMQQFYKYRLNEQKENQRESTAKKEAEARKAT